MLPHAIVPQYNLSLRVITFRGEVSRYKSSPLSKLENITNSSNTGFSSRQGLSQGYAYHCSPR